MTKTYSILQANPNSYFQQYREIILKKIEEVLDSGCYINGEQVKLFEKQFAQYCNVAHAVGVANGTDAIELTLRALNIGPGDLVFTVSHTAVATVAAIERTGALPVLVDITQNTYTMCPVSLAETLSAAYKGKYPGKPAAIIPVHLYGECADMDEILHVAGQLPVIEDCAQAHGAKYNNKNAGSMGIAGTFSFYPTKNLGTLGDGGCIVTSNTLLAEQIKILREYGWKQRYISNSPGINSRLDELHASILNIFLPMLNKSNEIRRKIAKIYYTELQKLKSVQLPLEKPNRTHVYHLYVIQLDNRDMLKIFLSNRGITTGIHYPQPVHKQPAYINRLPLSPHGLPETDKVFPKILSLPLYPGLSENDILYITSTIQKYFDSSTWNN